MSARVSAPEGDRVVCVLDHLAARGRAGTPGQHPCVRPESSASIAAALVSFPGLAVDAAVQVHRRVDAERRAAPARDGQRLALGVPANELRRGRRRAGRAPRSRRGDVEGDAQLLEDGPALRRGRGENEPRHGLRHDPDLLGRPPTRPLRGDERIAGRRILGRPHLDQVLDLEAVGPEKADPVAVTEMELDAGACRPATRSDACRSSREAASASRPRSRRRATQSIKRRR